MCIKQEHLKERVEDELVVIFAQLEFGFVFSEQLTVGAVGLSPKYPEAGQCFVFCAAEGLIPKP